MTTPARLASAAALIADPARAVRLQALMAGEALRAARTCRDRLAGRLGVDLEAARRARRLARDCMDWSERRPHPGGGLGRALCTLRLARGWIRRQPGEGLAHRVVVPTLEGARVLREAFGVRLDAEAA